MAVSPDGSTIYVANSYSSTVSVINAQTQSEVAAIVVGSMPIGVALAGSKLYVTNFTSSSVSVISTQSNTVTSTIAVGGSPFGVAISVDGTKAYVVSQANASVSVIDTATDTTVGSPIPLSGASGPLSIAVLDAKLYVTDFWSTKVFIVDTANGNAVSSVNVGAAPYLVTAHGSKVYASLFHGAAIAVIDTANGNAVTTLSVGAMPVGIAVAPDGSTIYVGAYGEDKLDVIDTSDNTMTTIAVDHQPWGVAAVGDLVVVSNSGGTDYQTSTLSILSNAAAPTLTAVDPASGSAAGGTVLSLTGTGFREGAIVTVGGVLATNITRVSETSITATAPAHAEGLVDVVVINPDGQSATAAEAFTYLAAKTLKSATGRGTYPTAGTGHVTFTFGVKARVTSSGLTPAGRTLDGGLVWKSYPTSSTRYVLKSQTITGFDSTPCPETDRFAGGTCAAIQGTGELVKKDRTPTGKWVQTNLGSVEFRLLVGDGDSGVSTQRRGTPPKSDIVGISIAGMVIPGESSPVVAKPGSIKIT